MATEPMKELSEKVHEVHFSTGICSAEFSYNDQILVTGTPTGKKMARVRPKRTEKIRNPPQPVQRRVFLVSIPLQSYGGIFSGTPMMRQRRQDRPWQLLENSVHILRYWIVCIVNDDGDSTPSSAQLLDADFFDCPQEPLLRDPSRGDRTISFKLPRRIVETIEAIQELGRVSGLNDIVEGVRDELNGLWGSYYALLWNSQHFSIHLAYLILRQDSLPTAKTTLMGLLVSLRNSTDHLVVARHAGCILASAGFIIATMGVGAILAGGTAGGSVISHKFKEERVHIRTAALRAAFPRLEEFYG